LQVGISFDATPQSAVEHDGILQNDTTIGCVWDVSMTGDFAEQAR